MTNEEKQAYDWALHQNYQSVSAKNAKTLAEFVRKILSVKSGDPLTLEQLREMDGQPVWAECIKKWGIVDSKEDVIAFPGFGVLHFLTAGKSVYAYPAHIDREAWTAEWMRGEHPSGTHYLYCRNCGEKSGKRSMFCPNCGRAMTPDAWAMLEKRLRG